MSPALWTRRNVGRSGLPVSRTFSLQEDLAELGKTIERLRDVVLVVIDPITAYMGENLDSHKTADVRAVLADVAEWAESVNVAVLAITHPPKAAQSKAINSFTGSLAYVAHCRFAFIVADDPNDDGRKLLLPVKCNIGPKADGIAYRIVSWEKMPDVSRIEWDGAPVNVTANELVAGSKSANATTKAEAFLQDKLGFGSRPVTDLLAEAEAEGISGRTLNRAKSNLGVRSRRAGFKNGGWIWFLPGSEEDVL